MSSAADQTITTDQAQAIHFTNAISQSQAVIEFNLDGTIITANEIFCSTLGYRLDEIRGQHHRMFLDGAEAASPEYRAFWSDLAAGAFRAGEFRRITKSGEEIWMQASYSPVTDDQGAVYKIVKIASDITARTASALEAAAQARELANQINGFSASQAMIEFDLRGNVISANENFCKAMGYRLEEIQGQHHRMFCRPEDAASPEYRAFWADLGAGKFQAGEFLRVTRDGADLWILASYNPILDEEGRPYKVVKLASDITAQKLRALESEAEAQKVNEMMRQLPLNVMLVDRDLKLTYMNDSSRNTLRSLEHSLPVAVDDMIGTCIDVFHKDPSVQRRILGDPRRSLPHRAEFVLGGQDIELQADGVYDRDGGFIGCMASWSVVTEMTRL
ncbi:MAG: PAS domain-containing protein [Phycisphaerales bacterium JB059]